MKNEGIIMLGESGMDKGINIENKGANREPDKKPESKLKPEKKDTSISPRKFEEPRNTQPDEGHGVAKDQDNDRAKENEENVPESEEQKKQKGLLKGVLNSYQTACKEFLDEKGRKDFSEIKVKIVDKNGRETERSLADGVKEIKGAFLAGKLSEEQLGEIFTNNFLVMDDLLHNKDRTLPDGSKAAEKFGEAYYKHLGGGNEQKGMELHKMLEEHIKIPWQKGEQPDLKKVFGELLSQPGMAKEMELLGGMAALASGGDVPPTPVKGNENIGGDGRNGDIAPAPTLKDGKPSDEAGKKIIGEAERKRIGERLKKLFSDKNIYNAGILLMILFFLFAGLEGEFSEIVERTMERVITGRTVV